jgi:archaemetzincin
MERLEPLHQELGDPGPSDWLSVHPEPGQTFEEYRRSNPIRPHGRRDSIYIQPLGEFSSPQREVVEGTAEFTALFYDAPVRTREAISLAEIPSNARRRHPATGVAQLLTVYILRQVLAPRLPEDAAAYVAFTAQDLWPGEGWNFVFGQAALRERVGVWSIHRNGDPEKGAEAFRLCLLRTMKTAAHELGHMFSTAHCTAYRCGMNGSNTLEEKDRRPLAFCPDCLAKVCWATGADPLERCRRLAGFCRDSGLREQADRYAEFTRVLAD